MTELDSSGHFQIEIHRRIAELLERGEEAALATVIGVTGSCPGRHGMKLLLERRGTMLGTVGGGMMEDAVLAAMRECIERGEPRRMNLSLSPHDAGRVGICGGGMEVYVEPIGVHTVYLFGSGHVAVAVSRIAAEAGFRLVVLDDRREFATADRFPDAAEIHVGPFPEIFENVKPGPFSYVCLITRGFATDQEVLELAVAGGPYRYLGMIGSRQKIRTVYNALQEKGVTAESLAEVKAPIGIEIGAQTPGEIGVSVVAELIASKYAGNGEDPAESTADP